MTTDTLTCIAESLSHSSTTISATTNIVHTDFYKRAVNVLFVFAAFTAVKSWLVNFDYQLYITVISQSSPLPPFHTLSNQAPYSLLFC